MEYALAAGGESNTDLRVLKVAKHAVVSVNGKALDWDHIDPGLGYSIAKLIDNQLRRGPPKN